MKHAHKLSPSLPGPRHTAFPLSSQPNASLVPSRLPLRQSYSRSTLLLLHLQSLPTNASPRQFMGRRTIFFAPIGCTQNHFGSLFLESLAEFHGLDLTLY
jgi:hypothetical protein